MWNPQFKLLGNYPSPCAVILEIISVSAWNTISESSCTGDNSLTDSSYEYGVWIAVERNDGFKRFSSMWKQPTLSGSRLEFVASSFVTVEASLSRKPELALRRTSYIIVRKSPAGFWRKWLCGCQQVHKQVFRQIFIREKAPLMGSTVCQRQHFGHFAAASNLNSPRK